MPQHTGERWEYKSCPARWRGRKLGLRRRPFGEKMGLKAECDRRGTVAETPVHRNDIDASGDESGGMEVSERVKAHAGRRPAAD